MSQTVRRAISVIRALAKQPRTLPEVEKVLDVHRSTAMRLLQTLEEEGFARRGVDGRYMVGTELVSIAQQSLETLDLRPLGQPYLRTLHEKCGHTIHLAQFIGGQVIYIDKIDGTDGVRMYSRVGLSAEIHASGVGKAVLSQLPADRLERLLDSLSLTRHTAMTIDSREMLIDELARIRERGWATDNGEFEDFINCVAAPVRNSTGDIIAAISIATLQVISPLPELRRLIPDLQEAAENLSCELG